MDKGKGKGAGSSDGDKLDPTETFKLGDINEPKTMFHDEIDRARKAALEVMNNHSQEEAARIFMQGWNAAENVRKVKMEMQQGSKTN